MLWRKRDDYHIRSLDGRYSVSRVRVSPETWYIAWRWKPKPVTEIASVRLEAHCTNAERSAAIKAMQAHCEADATG